MKALGFSMLKKIKQWIHSFRLLNLDSDVSAITKTATVQEDVAAKEAVKRVRKEFKQQESAMNARALKAHGGDCKDPLFCEKKHCFKWAPDKIASDVYIAEDAKTLRKRMKKNMKIVNKMDK